MNNQKTILLTIGFVLNVLFQVLLARKMVLFETAFCFTYIGFLLILPYQMSKVYLLLIAFALGFCIDAFYDTMGIHTLACVVVAYLRPFLVHFLTTRSNINTDMIRDITVGEMGLPWYLTYALIMVLIHNSIVFLVEAGSFAYFSYTLKYILFTTLFSLFAIIVIQYLFYRKQKA